MIKKIIFVCGVACGLSANAQSSNFEGASVALNVNSATMTTEAASIATFGETSTNGSVQGAYSFALSEKGLFSIGATYAMGDLKAGSVSATSATIKAQNLYTVYAEPAYVIGTTAIYGKLAYIGIKGEFAAATTTLTENFTGTGYGFGVRTMLDKNIFMQVEFMTTKFNSKDIDSAPTEPGGTIGTVGIGYKF